MLGDDTLILDESVWAQDKESRAGPQSLARFTVDGVLACHQVALVLGRMQRAFNLVIEVG